MEREFHPAVVAKPGVDYVVHAFVEHIVEADPATFDYLEKVVEGSMLASVVYLPDFSTVQRKFRDSTIYLDTPFVLRVLGYAGDQFTPAAKELLELLRSHGASVACFDKTVTEVRGVLMAAGSDLGGRSRRAQSEVAATFMQQQMRRSDVELLVAALEDDLAKLNIRVLAAPGYSVRLGVDEIELEDVLATEVGYLNENAKRHDLDALTAIHRLRDGETQPFLEDCRAILLTTNDALVRAARKFFRVDAHDRSWPHAMVDTDLATLIWLKQPMKFPDLPRKQILADCYATLRPNQTMWNTWLDEIERLEASGDYTDAQLEIMRYSPDAQRALMDHTLGVPTAIDPAVAEEVYEAAAAQITAPVEEELARSRADLEKERALRQAAETETTDGREARLAAEGEAAARQVALDEAKGLMAGDRDRRHANLANRALCRAHGVAVAVGIVLSVAISIGLGASLFGDWVPGAPWPIAVRWFVGGTSLLALFGGIAATTWGSNIVGFTRRIEAWLQPKLFKRYMRAAGELV